MFCPKCGSEDTKVVLSIKGIVQERTRKCNDCGHVFQTFEALKYDEIWREYAKFTSEEIAKKQG